MDGCKSAFAYQDEDVYRREYGLTKREWLIGMIASGVAANSNQDFVDSRYIELSQVTINFADEIIKKLNEGENNE